MGRNLEQPVKNHHQARVSCCIFALVHNDRVVWQQLTTLITFSDLAVLPLDGSYIYLTKIIKHYNIPLFFVRRHPTGNLTPPWVGCRQPRTAEVGKVAATVTHLHLAEEQLWIEELRHDKMHVLVGPVAPLSTQDSKRRTSASRPRAGEAAAEN